MFYGWDSIKVKQIELLNIFTTALSMQIIKKSNRHLEESNWDLYNYNYVELRLIFW